ncbi:MAG: hypothetical protein R2851_25055 [Caldilineaceae bacterium]
MAFHALRRPLRLLPRRPRRRDGAAHHPGGGSARAASGRGGIADVRVCHPHHIGYRQGYRGINWRAFREAVSPVVEIFSFHGLSLSSEGPYPYLHSMGPRHEQSTAEYGWEQGHVFGIIGSTDHHNAFPGSYGYGRLGVWAPALSRDAVWEAIAQRRTYALTGDRMCSLCAQRAARRASHLPTGAVDRGGGGGRRRHRHHRRAAQQPGHPPGKSLSQPVGWASSPSTWRPAGANAARKRLGRDHHAVAQGRWWTWSRASGVTAPRQNAAG